MARQLWLLRHADAEPHGTRPDAERRLTARGERQALLVGMALRRMNATFQEVLVSPKVRARQTAELAASNWGRHCPEPVVHPPLAGDFDVSQARDALAGMEADGRLLLVGHEPDLSRLASDLIGGRLDLKKGGLAALRIESAAELILLLRPRELALIAGQLDLDV